MKVRQLVPAVSNVDVDVDNGAGGVADVALLEWLEWMRMLQSVHQCYMFEQMAVSKLRELGTAEYGEQLDDLSRLRYVVPRNTSTAARDVRVEG